VNETETLRGLVQRALKERAVSGRTLAMQAERAGHHVTHTTLNHLAAGTYRFQPSPETIRAVAWAAKVSDEVAFAAAGVPMPGPPFAEELPPGVDYLSQPSRKAAVEILRALVRAEKAGEGDAEQPAAMTAEPDGSAPTIDELTARRLRAEKRADEAVEHPEEHAAQPMPKGGTEYQKRVAKQDADAERPEGL